MEFKDFYYISLYSYESGISLNSNKSELGYSSLSSRLIKAEELGIDESLLPDTFKTVGALSGNICKNNGSSSSNRYDLYPLTGNISFYSFSTSNRRNTINVDIVWDNSNGFNNTSNNIFTLFGNVIIPKIKK